MLSTRRIPRIPAMTIESQKQVSSFIILASKTPTLTARAAASPAMARTESNSIFLSLHHISRIAVRYPRIMMTSFAYSPCGAPESLTDDISVIKLSFRSLRIDNQLLCIHLTACTQQVYTISWEMTHQKASNL